MATARILCFAMGTLRVCARMRFARRLNWQGRGGIKTTSRIRSRGEARGNFEFTSVMAKAIHLVELAVLSQVSEFAEAIDRRHATFSYDACVDLQSFRHC